MKLGLTPRGLTSKPPLSAMPPLARDPAIKLSRQHSLSMTAIVLQQYTTLANYHSTYLHSNLKLLVLTKSPLLNQANLILETTAKENHKLNQSKLEKLSILCTEALKSGPLPTEYTCTKPPPPPLIGQKPSLASILNLPTPAHTANVLPIFRPQQTTSQPNTEPKSSILNLSDHNLTQTEKNILEKGLTFAPSKKFDHFATVKDVLNFTRNLRIKHFFDNLPTTPENAIDPALTKFAPPSKWDPPPLPPSHPLEQFISFLLVNVSEPSFAHNLHTTDNITTSERKAITDLRNNSNIMILPADKGSTTVILNKSDYIHEGEEQLKDTKTYRHLKSDPTNTFCQQIDQFLTAQGPLQGLSQKSIKLLTPEHPTTPVLYLLPKIHKEQRPPPGRPIVAGCGSPTERISALVDTHLQPLVQKLPSYIKDTGHFLQCLHEITTIPQDSFLVTIDVTSLYTNIPHTSGLSALEHYLNQRSPSNSKPSTSFLIELARLTLTNNSFRFLDKHYLQLKGTAMGTRMAPSYANLFMGRLEEQFLSRQSVKPHCWMRYIDDIFMIWTSTEASLIQFLEDLNTCSSLKFTWTYSTSHAVFLDVELTLHNGNITTTVHTKPTNTLQYLHFDSYHPFHSKKSLPYSLATRAKRICTTSEDLDKQCKLIAQAFKNRGYPPQLVHKQIQRATSTTDTHARSNNSDIPLVVPYHEGLGKLKTILSSGHKILASSPLTQNLLSKPPRLVFKRPPNLRNKLVRPKLPPNSTVNSSLTPKGSHPCNKPRCSSCAIHQPSTSFTSRLTNQTYPIHGSYNCATENLIYQLQCNFCNAEYIGLTTNTLRQRMNGHRADTKQALAHPNTDFLEKPVAAHAVSHSTSFDSCYTTRVVRALPPSNNSAELRRWELAHQYITKSRQPPGLNIR